MDLGFEGGFTVHRSSINSVMHPSWLKHENSSDWITLPKTFFQTIFANDILKSAESSWNSNFESTNQSIKRFYLGSIVDLVKLAWERKFSFPEVEVVTGGFPCQDFSLAGKRGGFNSHKNHQGESIVGLDNPTVETRGMLYFWMRHVIQLVLPYLFVAENVKGLVSLGDTKKTIEHDFRNVGPGYKVVEAKVLNAKNYGVPQNRERIIFIGIRADKMTAEAKKIYSSNHIPVEFDLYPRKTHSDMPLFQQESFMLPFTRVADYVLDLGEPDGSADPSHQVYSKAKFYGTHCQGNKEVDLWGVSPTIRSEHHGNIEFRRLSKKHGGKYFDELNQGFIERRLSVRECARLQTFPDSFKFVTNGQEPKVSGSDAYKLIGNAVPPLLAYNIATRLEYLWPFIFID